MKPSLVRRLVLTVLLLVSTLTKSFMGRASNLRFQDQESMMMSFKSLELMARADQVPLVNRETSILSMLLYSTLASVALRTRVKIVISISPGQTRTLGQEPTFPMKTL
jgi:hypothetical protein